MDTEKMGRFIAERRKDKHMTQKDFARMLNITDKAVSKWERGISCPDISLLPSVADILGVTIHELLNGEQSNTEPEGPAAGRENALQYVDSEAEAAAGTMRSRCAVAFSLLLLAGSAACAVINTAVSGKLTWAPFPIVSMAFAWLVFFPVLKAGKKGLFGALLALSVFILPFLYVLSRLLKSNGNILAAGAPTAALRCFSLERFRAVQTIKNQKTARGRRLVAVGRPHMPFDQPRPFKALLSAGDRRVGYAGHFSPADIRRRAFYRRPCGKEKTYCFREETGAQRLARARVSSRTGG